MNNKNFFDNPIFLIVIALIFFFIVEPIEDIVGLFRR
jgi:hypothetical protein